MQTATQRANDNWIDAMIATHRHTEYNEAWVQGHDDAASGYGWRDLGRQTENYRAGYSAGFYGADTPSDLQP